MKRLLFFAICVIALCLFASCSTSYQVSRLSDYTSAYVGKNHNYIVASLGAPDRQTSDGAGGTILIYEDVTTNSVATAYDVNYLAGTYTPGVQTNSTTRYLHLFVNSNGVCYNVKTNHQKTIIERNTKATGWLIGGLSALFAGPLIGLIASLFQ